MTPNEHDNPETDRELKTTEILPFGPGTGRDQQNSDDTMPDVPMMEQLPDPGALPDPGYPEMPASARDYAGGVLAMPPFPEPADGPGAPAWPRPPEPAGSAVPATPAEPARPAEPTETGPAAHHAAGARPSWSPHPYAAAREPDQAPPLHGPAVPWSEVRAAADHEAAGQPLTAPPSLSEHGLPGQAASPPGEAVRDPGGIRTPPEGFVRQDSAELSSDVLLAGRRPRPDGGWRQTVYRATGGLVRVGESSASMRRRELTGRVRTPVAGGHHRVAVLSLKGGVGKTTVTVGLGATLATLRGDRVIAVDGNPDRGTLSDKVRLETRATIRDLLNDRAMIGRYADVRAFTSQTPSRLEILASDRDPGVSVAFSADDYRAVVGVLEHYYSLCITDCGTGLLHSAMSGILELADQIVLVSSPSVDGARSASATLDWLEAHDYGDLVRDGVVVLSAIRRNSRSTVDLDRLEQHFAARCRAVVRIPYDPHLEEGAEVELEYLNPETADAYLTLAALVADGFARPGRSVANAAPGSPFA
jgi:MinD-like ATPase involved in chromosome partitioning or flagellar assembly